MMDPVALALAAVESARGIVGVLRRPWRTSVVDQRERVLYQHDKYRIVAWAERFPAERAPRLYVRVDERRAQFWHNVVTWHARPSPAPWWKPWERKNELLPVVERCVRQIEELEHADRTAEVTIDAVAEVMDAVAPLVASLSPAHPNGWARVHQYFDPRRARPDGKG